MSKKDKGNDMSKKEKELYNKSNDPKKEEKANKKSDKERDDFLKELKKKKGK